MNKKHTFTKYPLPLSPFIFIFLLSIGGYGQTKEKVLLTASIRSVTQHPVKNATVFVNMKRRRVRSNKRGTFSVRLKEGDSLISVFSPKHGLLSEPYLGENGMLLQYGDNAQRITKDETIAMGFIWKKPPKEQKDFSEYLSIYDLIVAEIPGAQVSGTTIRLRGNAINSVNAGQDPLIILDGTPVGSVHQIMPFEVATISALRGQDAAIYGARGANGVLLITLKK